MLYKYAVGYLGDVINFGEFESDAEAAEERGD